MPFSFWCIHFFSTLLVLLLSWELSCWATKVANVGRIISSETVSTDLPNCSYGLVFLLPHLLWDSRIKSRKRWTHSSWVMSVRFQSTWPPFKRNRTEHPKKRKNLPTLQNCKTFKSEEGHCNFRFSPSPRSEKQTKLHMSPFKLRTTVVCDPQS